MDNFNGLTPAETERLAMLSEECAEVIHVIGKILRHGYENHHPRSTMTNRANLMRELGDIKVIEELMFQAGDISLVQMCNAMINKRANLPKYLHHQDDK